MMATNIDVNNLVTSFLGAAGGALITCLAASKWIMEAMLKTTLDLHLQRTRDHDKSLQDAETTVKKYGQPLMHSCWRLEFTFQEIIDEQEKHEKAGRAAIVAGLQTNYTGNESLAWYSSDEGYFLADTAYRIAATAAWLQILYRDVVFLPFENGSATANFLNITEAFKRSLTTGDGDQKTLLRYDYLEGVGDLVIDDHRNCPISFARFIEKLRDDKTFQEHFTLLFVFLRSIGDGHHAQLIIAAKQCLENIRENLTEKLKLPLLSQTPAQVSR